MSDTTKPQPTPTVRTKLGKFQHLLVWCGPAALILWFLTATGLNPFALLTGVIAWLVFGIVVLLIFVIILLVALFTKTSTD